MPGGVEAHQLAVEDDIRAERGDGRPDRLIGAGGERVTAARDQRHFAALGIHQAAEAVVLHFGDEIGMAGELMHDHGRGRSDSGKQRTSIVFHAEWLSGEAKGHYRVSRVHALLYTGVGD